MVKEIRPSIHHSTTDTVSLIPFHSYETFKNLDAKTYDLKCTRN